MQSVNRQNKGNGAPPLQVQGSGSVRRFLHRSVKGRASNALFPGEPARSFPHKQNPLFYKNREKWNTGKTSKQTK